MQNTVNMSNTITRRIRRSPTLSDLDVVEDGIRSKKTHWQIAVELNKARSRITNLARLLDLPQPVLSAVRTGRLAPKTAEALLALKEDAEIISAFRHVVAHGLSADRTRAWLRDRKAGATNSAADVAALERRMSEELSSQVTITKSAGVHVISIRASDLDCIDGIVQRLGIEL
ncbi:MAG: putative chromosome-partitioning protein ParB [Firmicutes bacterium]|nr:putative chromosome-partitioning protein ParB [Bacillota bacterium]